MSYRATAWAYELPLKGPAKPVLVALADFADEAGSCYPGQERLCAMTGLSIRTLRRALDRLEDLGLLLRERRFDTYGHRTSDRYYLQIGVQSLPVTLTSGQSDLRSESPSLPVRESIPTGHSDRVTVRRTISDPSGGATGSAPTPEPVENPTATQELGHGEPATPWCKRHAATEGIDRPCRACKLAADRHAATIATGGHSQPWQPRKPVIHMPGLCDAHRQPENACEMCEREARDILTDRFGGTA